MSSPRSSERRHLWLGRFWVLNVAVVLYVYCFQAEMWKKASVLYLVLVSLYANLATEYGNAKAAEAARVSDDTWYKKLLRWVKG